MFEEYREGQKDDDKFKKHAHDLSLCGMYAKSLKEWCDDSRPLGCWCWLSNSASRIGQEFTHMKKQMRHGGETVVVCVGRGKKSTVCSSLFFLPRLQQRLVNEFI